LALILSLAGISALPAQPTLPDDEDPDPATLERLVKSLGSDDFRSRYLAQKTLRKVGDLAVPYLERHRDREDLELRRRLEELLVDIKVTGEVFSFAGHEKGIISLAMLPGDRRALTASEDGTVRLVDLTTGGEVRRYEGHTKEVWALAVAPGGKTFAS